MPDSCVGNNLIETVKELTMMMITVIIIKVMAMIIIIKILVISR